MKKYFLSRNTSLEQQEYKLELTKLLQLKLIKFMLTSCNLVVSTFNLKGVDARRHDDVVVIPP